MTHSFDVDIASEVGVVEAIFLQHFEYWHIKNVANNKHFYDNRTWTYNSIRGYVDIFPYLTEKQIRGVLDKLEKAELITSGNYNKNTFDRTKWYALTDKAICLLGIMHLPSGANRYIPNGQMETPLKANGFAPEGKPIPVIETIIEPITKTITTEPETQKLAEARSDDVSLKSGENKKSTQKVGVTDSPEWVNENKEKQRQAMKPDALLPWKVAEIAIRINTECKRIAESKKKENQAYGWTFETLLEAFLTFNKATYGDVSNWKTEAAARRNFIQWLPKFLLSNKGPMVEATPESTQKRNQDILNRITQ